MIGTMIAVAIIVRTGAGHPASAGAVTALIVVISGHTASQTRMARRTRFGREVVAGADGTAG